MKKILVLMANTLLLTTFMHAQTETLDIATFITPQGWQRIDSGSGFIIYRQPLSATGQGCVLTIISPQPSSGNPENDVKTIFAQMYPGWQFSHSDKRHDNLMKGYTKQGFEYYMMEADMQRSRPGGEQWDYESGAALVISMGNQIAIAALRHEPIGLYCKCKQRYDYWGRFLNTFTIKNSTAPKANTESTPARLIGSWMIFEGRTIGEYIFAANGHYQYIGAYGNHTKISNDIIESRSSVFQGDGTYTIKGDQLMLKRKGKTTPETYRFRFEKSNQGSTGWKDRIYILDEKPADRGLAYEVCYERSPQK